jgi:hypothetical protein
METTTFTINDKDVGDVYFVKNEHQVFVIVSELRRCFDYYPLNGNIKSKCSESFMLRKSIVCFDLHRTSYYEYLRSSAGNAGKFVGIYSKKCIEINKLIDYLKNSKQSPSPRKESVKRFLLDNFQSINKQEELPGLFKSASRNTVSDSFDNMSNELSSLKNKFKAMQINLDSQKEQIDAKDKSIFALRAKIKELEEQNADLKSQFEKQSTLNKRFDAFVQSLQSVNNVLHDDLR